MRPYIISHMMTSVDGRIDCPMVGQLSTDEYYIALEKLGPCSKLSGRITTALECSAVKEESTPMEGTPIGHKSVYVASKAQKTTTTKYINSTGMEPLELTQEWDKTFPQSDKVEHKKITFHNRYGITLAADLYKPKNTQGHLAAIAASDPYGVVKEQVSSRYAQTLAE